MATYYNNKEERRDVNLMIYGTWKIMQEAMGFDDYQEEGCVPIMDISPLALGEIFDDVNPLYPDFVYEVKLWYCYEDDDRYFMRPKAVAFSYPAYESSGSDDVPNDEFERKVELTGDEKAYFSCILQEAIGKTELPEKVQEEVKRFAEAIDEEALTYSRKRSNNTPLTVGFLPGRRNARVYVSPVTAMLASEKLSEENFARIPYVLANPDDVSETSAFMLVKKYVGEKTFSVIVDNRNNEVRSVSFK